VSRRRLFGALVFAGIAVLAPSGPGYAAGRVPTPTLVVGVSSGKLGDLVPAALEHWPAGLLTVSVCGNAGRRGSEDCDLRSAFTVNMPAGGGTRVQVALVRPPVDCPCVVRAATQTNEIVRVAPVAIDGVPEGSGTPPAATSVAAGGLVVRARIVDDGSLTDAFGVGVTRTLRLTLDNRGPSATPPLQVTGGVGRDVESGEAFSSRQLATIPAGARRTITIPIELSTPAHGDYAVFGTVYGLDAPVRFHRGTSADPWALELAVPLLVLVVARVVRRRERRRAAESIAAATPELVLEPFPDCSPEVGNGDEGRYPSPSYDPHDRPSQTATHAASLV
jgi:hypothetical protein